MILLLLDMNYLKTNPTKISDNMVLCDEEAT